MDRDLDKSSVKLSNSVALDLYLAIKIGKYQVGTWLPTESRLSVKYNVSRNTIREAIALIRDAELVITVKGSGTQVISNLGNLKSGIFSQNFLVRRQLLTDLYDFRRVLEVEIVGKAALRRSEKDLQVMSENLHLLESCVATGASIIPVGFDFHKSLAEAANSDIALGMLTNLRGVLTHVMGRLSLLKGVDSITLKFHRAIFEAVEAGDVIQARKCMEDDMESAKQQLLWVLEKYPQSFDTMVG